jgi:micrococcal nuclease
MGLGVGKHAVPLAAGLLLIGMSSPANADPCEAIRQSGPLPAWVEPGAAFAGRVRHVIDGDSLCVGSSPNPVVWVEVRLAGFYAAELRDPGGSEAKAMLHRAAFGREVRCTVTTRGRVRSYDRVVASCRVRGRDLADQMREQGVVENR